MVWRNAEVDLGVEMSMAHQTPAPVTTLTSALLNHFKHQETYFLGAYATKFMRRDN